MDPIAHALTGAAICDALVPESAEGKKPLYLAMFLGVAPDFDIIPGFAANFPGNVVGRELLIAPQWMWLHRNYSHSLPVLAAAGLVAGLVAWRLWGLGMGKGLWCLLAFFALLSHSILDIVTGGVHFWQPFSPAWERWAWLPVIDPPTLVLLAACWFANHPLKPMGRRTGTLASVERGFLKWHAIADRRMGRAGTARLFLAVIALQLAVRAFIQTM